MSAKGKKFVALSLMTFIAFIVIGAAWGHHVPGIRRVRREVSVHSKYNQ